MKRFIHLILLLGFLTIFLGCKKYSKELTTVNFHLYNPVTNEAYAGVKVWVLQEKNTSSGFNSSSETEMIWEGVTDAYGKAFASFKAYNSTKYSYWQDAENSFVQNPNLKLLKQPEFLPLNKNEENEVVYLVAVPASFVFEVKNVNCFDENDRFRFRRSWVYGSQYTNQFGWTNWSEDQFGCYELISDYNNYYSDIIITQYEVERNGVLNTYLDTFSIYPNSMDTLRIYY